MMTDAEDEAAHERYMAISDAIDALVAEMTNGMTAEQDKYIRDLLNDNQRYWRV